MNLPYFLHRLINRCTHSARTCLASLVVGSALVMGTGMPTIASVAVENGNGGTSPAQEKTTGKISLNNEEKSARRIRKENDNILKTADPLYPRQAKALAQQYRETAHMVARQGGNPGPLLDAAAYFEKQAELGAGKLLE